MDRFPPMQRARPRAAQQHSLPDVEIVGGEVSWRSNPLVQNNFTRARSDACEYWNPTHAPQQTMHTRSALQLALEFVPVAPIRSIGKDFVRIRLNQASFA